MDNTLNLSSLLGTNVDLLTMGKTLLMAGGAVIIFAFLIKLLFGKGSGLNRTICAVLGILFFYACTIIVYVFNPAGLADYIPPLPFLAFSGSDVYLFQFTASSFPVICSQVLSMILLAFVYLVIDDFMPRGVRLYWLLYRLLTICMAMALHYFVTWLTNQFLPAPLIAYAPTALTVILFVLLFLGLLKVILGLVLAVVNPILGGIYAFFFASRLGKSLSRAVLASVVLSSLVYVLTSMGYYAFSVAPEALITYIPTAGILLLVWFVLSIL